MVARLLCTTHLRCSNGGEKSSSLLTSNWSGKNLALRRSDSQVGRPDRNAASRSHGHRTHLAPIGWLLLQVEGAAYWADQRESSAPFGWIDDEMGEYMREICGSAINVTSPLLHPDALAGIRPWHLSVLQPFFAGLPAAKVTLHQLSPRGRCSSRGLPRPVDRRSRGPGVQWLAPWVTARGQSFDLAVSRCGSYRLPVSIRLSFGLPAVLAKRSSGKCPTIWERERLT